MNRTSRASDKEKAPGRRARVSWPLVLTGIALLALAGLMYFVVVNYRPAQAAPVEGRLEETAPSTPRPGPEPSRTPPAERRSVPGSQADGRTLLAPRPRRPKPVKKAGPPPEKPKYGRIEISTRPGGYPLTIDGRDAGKTTEDVRVIDLEPGTYTVEIVFPNNTRWAQTINIVAGRKYTCGLDLNYRPVAINIPSEGTPPDAQPGGRVETVELGELSSSRFKVDVERRVVTLCPDDESGANPRLRVKATAPNLDGEPLRYKWTASGGRLEGEGTDVVWDLSGVQPGVYKVEVTVEDDKGGTGFANTPVVVRRCRQPSVKTDGEAGVSVRPVSFVRLPPAVTVKPATVSAEVKPCDELLMPEALLPAEPDTRRTPIRQPRPVQPVPQPSPTPSPVIAPAPAPQVTERDKIVARYPERLLTDKDSTLRVELSRVLGDVVAGTTTAGGKVETVDRPGAIAGAANQEATMAGAFGSGYKAYATVRLISEDLVINASPQPEQSLDPKSLEWEWQVRPKEGVEEEARFAFQIDVVWRGDGLPDIHRSAVWRRDFSVPVGLPADVLMLKYGSPASGVGGGGAMLAGVFKGRRRKKKGEADDEGAAESVVAPSAGADEPSVVAQPAGAAVAPAPPAPAADEVHCTVYAPPEARPGDMLKVQVFAHLEEQAGLLAGLAAERDDEAREGGSEALKGKIERGKELTFTLDMPGLKVKEQERSLAWEGEPDCVRFTVTVPEDSKPKNVWGTVEILYESVPVGEVEFKLKVVAEAAEAAPAPAEQKEFIFKKAFISYSRKDDLLVLEKVQMLEAQGIECFLDTMSFRPGEEWRQMIERYIDESDVFFLFWSSAAKASREVEKEWEYALERSRRDQHGRPRLKPVPIEGPPVVVPPPELSHLHFDDRYRYFIKAKQDVRREASAPTA